MQLAKRLSPGEANFDFGTAWAPLWSSSGHYEGRGFAAHSSPHFAFAVNLDAGAVDQDTQQFLAADPLWLMSRVNGISDAFLGEAGLGSAGQLLVGRGGVTPVPGVGFALLHKAAESCARKLLVACGRLARGAFGVCERWCDGCRDEAERESEHEGFHLGIVLIVHGGSCLESHRTAAHEFEIFYH